MAIRFLSSETISGTLTVSSTGGSVFITTNGHIESTQNLDVATAGGRLTGKSSRGYLGAIHIEQLATSADGGEIYFATAASGSTSGTERMTITSEGGISFGSTGTAYGGAGQVLTSAGNAPPTWTTPTTGTVTGSGTATRIAFWSSTSALSSDGDLYWDNSNKRLAIGTNTPSYPFDVIEGTEVQARFVGSSTGHTQGAIVLSSGTGDTPGARGQGVYRFNEGNDTTWYTGTAYNAADTYIWARQASTASLDTGTAQTTHAMMTLTSAGNVGIGTTAIPTNGYIASGGGWKMLQIGQSSQIAAYGTDDEIAICQNTYLNTSGVFQAITSNVAGSSIILVDGKMYFKNASTSGTAQTTSTRMFIDTAGKVGIGTTVPPFQKLTITGVSGAADGLLENGILSLTTGTGVIADTRLLFGIVDDDYAWLQAADYGVAYRDIALNPNGGNVLIGGTAIQAVGAVTFDKGGNGFTITNNTTSGAGNGHEYQVFRRNSVQIGSIVMNGTTGVTYGETSDYRLKENVIEITNALDRVSKLKPSRFNFITEKDRTVDGFLAHEVQDIVPEAVVGVKDQVDENRNPKYQSIDKSKLVPLLVGAIQELKAEIEILKNK